MVQASRGEILAKLQRDILPLQGYKATSGASINIGCAPIANAFPNQQFPTGVIHEFINTGNENFSAPAGFISGVLKAIMQNGGVVIWISTYHSVFPAALAQLGIDPSNILFIHAKNEKHALWATEEALKCNGLAAVVSEVKQLDFTISRRWQLAVEQSQVTGFILHSKMHSLNTIASIARWKVTHVASVLPGDLPGVGFPRWRVELIKVRNGKPSEWIIEWNAGKFIEIKEETTIRQMGRKAV